MLSAEWPPSQEGRQADNYIRHMSGTEKSQNGADMKSTYSINNLRTLSTSGQKKKLWQHTISHFIEEYKKLLRLVHSLKVLQLQRLGEKTDKRCYPHVLQKEKSFWDRREKTAQKSPRVAGFESKLETIETWFLGVPQVEYVLVY